MRTDPTAWPACRDPAWSPWAFVDGYLRANERDDEFGVKEVFIPTIPLPTMNYSAFARIDPARGVDR